MFIYFQHIACFLSQIKWGTHCSIRYQITANLLSFFRQFFFWHSCYLRPLNAFFTLIRCCNDCVAQTSPIQLIHVEMHFFQYFLHFFICLLHSHRIRSEKREKNTHTHACTHIKQMKIVERENKAMNRVQSKMNW